MSRLFVLLFLFGGICLFAPRSALAVTIDWTPVGNPGNAADPFDYGAVGYAYNIGTTEVTNSQYAEFLNAVGATDTYGLYNTGMGGQMDGGITQSGSSGSYSYSVKSGYAKLPVILVSWGDAARFANWLHNGQPSGPQNASTTKNGSYFLNGAITATALNSVTRSSTATIVLPSGDEWYKAAYYNPATSSYFQYPTSSNVDPSNAFLDAGNNANFFDVLNGTFTTGIPSGPHVTEVGHFATSESPYGTFDQGGNVREWNEESRNESFGSFRSIEGGSFVHGLASLYFASPDFFNSTSELIDFGFRVASVSVPEPSSGVLAVIACGIVWWWRKRLK